MGYIFDAMNRAMNDGEPRDPSPAPPPQADPPLPFDTAGADAADASPPGPRGGEDDVAPVVAELQSLADFVGGDEEVDQNAETSFGVPAVIDTTADEEPGDDSPRDEAGPGPSEPLPMDPVQLGRIDDRLVVLTDPGSVIAEEYRSIRTSILARWKNKRHLVHTITSATPQEGKTITSMNLGLSFAELRNRRTVIVECDLRLPTISKLLQIDNEPGLIGYLDGDLSLDEITRQVGDGGVHVITAGGRANNDAVQMLSSQRMANLLDALRARFDHVIVDTPPVVELADAGIIGALSDDVLLIARMNRTPRSLIERAVRTLGSYNAPVVGMVATDQKRLRGRYYYYRYGYRYSYTNRDAA